MDANQKKIFEQLAALGEVKFIQNTKDGLIKAISEMDIIALEAILEDGETYQDTTKELFLEKLAIAFEEFKTEDTFLEVYEGKCTATECSNANKTGVSFVGNNSGRYLNLIIELYYNGTIKDIYHCSNFCSNSKNLDPNKKNIKISVFNDEKVSFKRSSNFTYLDSKASEAIRELKYFESTLISRDVLLGWKDKYESFRANLKWSMLYKNLNTFSDYYSKVNEICGYLKCEEEASPALKELSQIDNAEKQQLLQWLVKYETLFKDLTLLPFDVVDEEAIKIGKQRLHRDLSVYFSIDLFQNCLSFYNAFEKIYHEKLKDYNTLSQEEEDDLIPFDDNYEELSSLKYHLQKRGLI